MDSVESDAKRMGLAVEADEAARQRIEKVVGVARLELPRYREPGGAVAQENSRDRRIHRGEPS